MGELSPYVERLLRVMTGPPAVDARFRGEPVDLSKVSDEELGALFAAAYSVGATGERGDAGDLARRSVREDLGERQPRFTPETCAQCFTALVEWGRSGRVVDPSIASGALLRCGGSRPGGLAEPAGELARHLLGRRDGPDQPYAVLALVSLAGAAMEHWAVERIMARAAHDGPLARDELEVVLALDTTGRALVAEAEPEWYSTPWRRLPDAFDRLAGLAAYAAFARRALDAADARIAAIQSGKVPYAPEKAFSRGEADALGRATRVALLRDEPWLGELLARLLPGIAVAPVAKKTVPSHRACTALAGAVGASPTPETVAALRQARRVVRHAGVAKKLDWFLRTAERNLARRPEVALRLPDPGIEAQGGQERSRRVRQARGELGTLARVLEGGYLLETVYGYGRWRAELSRHPLASTLISRLIWEVEVAAGRWQAILPRLGEDGLEFADVTGEPVSEPMPEAAVRLWHPRRSSPEQCSAWRDRIVALRLHQPFRQAFREHYTVEVDGPKTDMFGGHLVAIRPLLGLALREGWEVDDLAGELRRGYGSWRFSLAVGARLFPTAGGWGDVGAVRLERRNDGGWRPASYVGAPEVLVSEALRNVDLLVSVAAFGLDEDASKGLSPRRWERPARLADRPLGEAARMRRAALSRVLADLPGSDRIEFGDRHVHVDGYAVHLATARVTRDGEPVSVEVPDLSVATPLPWLPYDERLLERIVRTVVALMRD